MTPQTTQIAFIVGGLIAGSLCGLIPLNAGLKNGKQTLAYVGLVSRIICGAILGLLLALPVALIFLAIIKYT